MADVKKQANDVADAAKAKAGEIGDRAREGFEEARDSVARGYRQAEGVVARHPGSSVAAGFGLGLGLGVLLAMVLTQREESAYERYVPDSIRDLPSRFRGVARRVRDLPETLADYLPGH